MRYRSVGQLLLIVLFLAGGALFSCQGASLNSETVKVRMVNDLGKPVRASICKDHACQSHEPLELLASNASTTANTSVDSPETWIVVSESGATLGCLVLKQSSYPDTNADPAINMSSMQRC